VSSLQFNLQMNGYDEARALAFRQRVVAELRAAPGVSAVALASRLPLAPDINMEGIRIQGHHQPQDEPTPIDSVGVGPDYFRAVGVPILEGRSFTEDETSGEKKVLIVNQAFARRYWPGRTALGQHVYTSGFDKAPHEIVGVARDHKVRSVGEEPRPYLHFPATRSSRIALVVRTVQPSQAALPALRAAVLKLEPEVVFTDDVPAAEVAAVTLAPTRIGAALLGAFGSLALLLAAVGLYGVVSYSVTLRTREMGVRMALGAQRADVLRLVFRQGARLALVGVGVGALLAALVGRVFSALPVRRGSLDPGLRRGGDGSLAVAAAPTSCLALTAARVDHAAPAQRVAAGGDYLPAQKLLPVPDDRQRRLAGVDLAQGHDAAAPRDGESLDVIAEGLHGSRGAGRERRAVAHRGLKHAVAREVVEPPPIGAPRR
jgi:hypothetical protein